MDFHAFELVLTRTSAGLPCRSTRRDRCGRASVIIVAVVALIVVAGALIYTSRIRAEQRAAEEKYGQDIATITGLGRPITNKLDAEFIDANADLIADAPTDASKQSDPAEIVFSYVASDRNTDELAATFKPFTNALSRTIGKPVRYQPISDVDAQVMALHDGSLHITALNTGAVPTAVDVGGFVPVALLGNESGTSNYQVKIIASTRTNITDIDGLRGHELTLTETASNSGFKAPLVLMQEKFGMRAGFDFGIRYSLGHAESIEGLVNGTFDTIAVASDVLARAEAAGTIKPDQYRVLYTSDPFPTACFGFAHDLKPELAAKIRSALTDFHFANDATAAYFAASGQTRLVKLDYAKDFALVREIDDKIGYEHKRHLVSPTTEPATQAAVTE